MPVHTHHTAPTLVVSTDAWTREVVPQLPADLEAQARAHAAFVRVRGLASAGDLLRALLLYALEGSSFRALGLWAVLVQLGNLSDTAWRKRLQRASSFLLWLLGELLAAKPTSATDLASRQRRLLLVDATRLRQVGGSGDDWRVHLAYDLLAGRLSQLQVSDHHTAEGLGWLRSQPGDLLVADRAYGYRNQLAAAQEQGSDVVLRVSLATFPLEDHAGQAFDAVSWLLGQHTAIATWEGWCRQRGQAYRVRLVASRLPPETRAAADKRVRRKAKRQGRQLRAQTLRLAGWLVLVTTLDASWTASDVLRLYRARWQVEVLFKRLKQLLRVTALRGRTVATLEASLRALLVAWALQEKEMASLRAALPDGAADPHAPASSWLLAQLSVQTLREQVRGTWTARRVLACLPELARFLVSSRRGRRQQEADVRAWLTERLLERVGRLAAV